MLKIKIEKQPKGGYKIIDLWNNEEIKFVAELKMEMNPTNKFKPICVLKEYENDGKKIIWNKKFCWKTMKTEFMPTFKYLQCELVEFNCPLDVKLEVKGSDLVAAINNKII